MNKTILAAVFTVALSLYYAPAVLAQTDNTEQEQQDPIVDQADKKPEYPGGALAFNQFIALNMEYPDSAMEAKAQGDVTLSIVIEKDGTVSNAKVLKDQPGHSCGAEAVRLVSAMHWKPGRTKKGEPQRVRTEVTVSFLLNTKD